jgi:hypothetical protein
MEDRILQAAPADGADAEFRAAVLQAREYADRGEFIEEEEMEAVYRIQGETIEVWRIWHPSQRRD